MTMPATLQLSGVQAWYDKSQVLRGVDLRVGEGEIVSLLGRNGAGRSTLVKAVMGMVSARGSVRLRGRELMGCSTFEVARAGIGYVPESRDVFPRLSVHQNLLLGEQRGAKSARWGSDDMYRLFPALAARRNTEAGVLSGGEQQMLSLCRTLMGDPDVILVDEPTEGLAPRIVEQVAQFLLTLKDRGVAVLLVEQKLAIALEISERCGVMGHGRIVFEGTPTQLRGAPDVRREWLEV